MELKAKISEKALRVLRQPRGGARLLRATGSSQVILVTEVDLEAAASSRSEQSR